MTTAAYRAQSTKVMESHTYFVQPLSQTPLTGAGPQFWNSSALLPWPPGSLKHTVSLRLLSHSPPTQVWSWSQTWGTACHPGQHRLRWKWISGGAHWLNRPPLALHAYPMGWFHQQVPTGLRQMWEVGVASLARQGLPPVNWRG